MEGIIQGRQGMQDLKGEPPDSQVEEFIQGSILPRDIPGEGIIQGSIPSKDSPVEGIIQGRQDATPWGGLTQETWRGG